MGSGPAWNLIFRAFLAGFLAAGTLQAEVFRVDDLAGGMHDSIPGHLIADNEATEIINFHVDPFSRGLIQREGSSRLNSTQFAGKKAVDLFTYVQDDGDEYLVAISSKSVLYSSDNGATFTTLITTATDGALYDGITFQNKFFAVSQSDGGWSFDGTAHATVSQMPSAKFMEKYQNRLWVANTVANSNRVYFSGLLLPSTWTTSTDYIDFPEPVTAIGKPYDGGLPIYTDNQTWMIRGTAPSNFYVQQISDVIGAAHNRTIQNFQIGAKAYQLFLSKGINQTENNLYALNGTEIEPIGNKILNTLAGISIGNSTTKNQTWDTATQFDAGTYSNTSSTVTAGSVVLSMNNTNLSNNNFESGTPLVGCTATIDDWTSALSANTVCWESTLVKNGSRAVSFSSADGFTAFNLVVLDESGNVLQTFSDDYASVVSDSFTQFSKSLSAYQGQRIKLRFLGTRGSGSGTHLIDTSSAFLATGGNVTYWVAKRSSGGTEFLIVDLVEGGKSTITSGTYTSEVVSADSAFASWGPFLSDYELNGGSMTFYVRTAASAGAVSGATYSQITPGQTIPGGTNRHLQWKVDFSSNSATNLIDIQLNSVTVFWTSASGASQPLGSAVFNGEYWLTYTDGSESRNQSILLMNRQGAFSTVSGINSYSLTVERGRLFSGDSATDTVNGGYVWELETGSTDNGTAVSARATLKNKPFPTLEDFDKSLASVYFPYAVTVGTFTASIIENFSEYSNDYTVYFASGTSYNRWKLEPLQQTTARNFALRFSNSYSGSQLKIYPPITYHFEKARLIKQ